MNKEINTTESNTDSESIIIEEVTKTSKFDFSTTKSSFKIKYILIPIFTVVLIIVGYFGVQYFIDVPTLNSINTNTITNEKLVLTSNKSPFHVKTNSKTFFSENKSGTWVVDLGELEGKNKLEVGGVINLGIIKIPSNKTNKFEVNRTYVKPKVEVNIPNYIETKELIYDIKILNNLIINKIYNSNEIIFDKSDDKKPCQLNKELKNVINCKFAKPESNIILTKLKIIDQYDNSTSLDEIKTEFVETNNFTCNQSVLENEGKLVCKGNKDAKIEYDQKLTEYKANTDIVIQEGINNGQFKKSFKITDIHKISKEINIDGNVDKDKLSIDMWSKKWSGVAGGEGYSGKDVIAKLNRDVNVKVRAFIVWEGKASDVTNDPINSRIKLLKSRINANTETNFLQFLDLYGGYEANQDKKFDYYLLDFTADNGKTIKFRCDYKFMCNQI